MCGRLPKVARRQAGFHLTGGVNEDFAIPSCYTFVQDKPPTRFPTLLGPRDERARGFIESIIHNFAFMGRHQRCLTGSVSRSGTIFPVVRRSHQYQRSRSRVHNLVKSSAKPTIRPSARRSSRGRAQLSQLSYGRKS